jgi:ABC-2 type transport system permease protein
VFGIILASVLLAAAGERGDLGGLDAGELVTMTFVAQGTLVVVAAFGWRELADRVRTGEIAVDLGRPVDVSMYWLAVFCGASGHAALARGIMPFVVGIVVFEARLPEDPTTWLWFALTIVGAALVASRWWFLVSLSSFWIIGDIRGIVQLAVAIQLFCSGSLVPLQVLPDGLANVVRATPFASLAQLPGEVLIERHGALGVLALQIGWAIALHLLGLLVLRRGLRKLVIDGG